MGSRNNVNISADNGLLRDDINPLPGPMWWFITRGLWHLFEFKFSGYELTKYIYRSFISNYKLFSPKNNELPEVDILILIGHEWHWKNHKLTMHYSDVIMNTMASGITSLAIVYSSVYSGADQRKHQSSASLAFHRWPVNSPHKGPVTRKMFPFNGVIMECLFRIHSPKQV